MKVEPCDTHPWKMYLIMSFEGAFLSYRKFRRNSYKIKIPPGGMRTRAKRNFVAEATALGARVLLGRTLCSVNISALYHFSSLKSCSVKIQFYDPVNDKVFR